MSLVRQRESDHFIPNSFGHVFDRFFKDAFVNSTTSNFVPKVDVAENDSAFEVHVSVPGMKKEDFQIELNNGQITIKGERKFENEKKEKNFHSVESHYGKFSRSFFLPDNVIEEKIEASYKDGILEVNIPKDNAKKLRSQVTVK